MIATIDAAGRILIPKEIREEMGFHAGLKVDLVVNSGRLEIDYAEPKAKIATDEAGRPVLMTGVPLTDETMYAFIDAGRR